jgi:glycosyltransferase involved in cell wall biosynthesis
VTTSAPARLPAAERPRLPGRASSRRRLLVFAINYAPEPTGTALVTTWQTEALGDLGWDVEIVTGVPHYPMWRRVPAPRRERRGAIRITRRRHYVPSEQTAIHRGAYEVTWVLSALPTIRSHRDVDVVLGIVPSLGGAALATLAAARYGVPCALLFQDVIARAAEMSGMAGAGRVAGPVRTVETALARRADGIGIVAEGYRDYFAASGVDPSRIFRIRNPARLGEQRERREQVRARLGWPDDVFVALHTGSIGFKQGLENVLGAADLARDDPGLLFVLQGDGNQKTKLMEDARRLRLPNVRFLPIAPADEFPGIVCAADALLLNQRGSVCNMSMPSKLAAYLLAGVPVIAAVSPGDETAQEVHASGGGVVIAPERPERLLDAIVKLRRDPARALELGRAGLGYAEQFLTTDSAIAGVHHFLETCLVRAANGTTREVVA